MSVESSELEILINSKANTAGLAQAKLAVNDLQTAHVNFGGALTAQEAAYAKNQLSLLESTKGHVSFKEQIEKSSGVIGAHGEMVGGLTAKYGALTSMGITPATAALMGGIAAVGLSAEAVKSAIEIAERHEKAQRSLAQAYSVSNVNQKDSTERMESFINSNKKYISVQSDVIEGWAKMTRAGINLTDTERDMNIALDLSVLKSIPLADAVAIVTKAQFGQARGLVELGIVKKDIALTDKEADQLQQALVKSGESVTKTAENLTKAQTAEKELQERLHGVRKLTIGQQQELENAHKKTEDAQKKHNDAVQRHNELSAEQKDRIGTINTMMDEARGKTDKGRQSMSDLNKSTTELNNKWQDLGVRIGPVMAKSLSEDVDWLNKALDWLQKLNTVNLNGLLGAIQGTFGPLSQLTGAAQAAARAFDWLNSSKNDAQGGRGSFGRGGGGVSGGSDASDGYGNPVGARAAGGPVRAGGTYLVGEKGPEILTMGSGGSGFVTPNSGSGGADMGQVVALLAQLVSNTAQPTGQTGMEAALYRATQLAGLNRQRGMAGV